MPNCQCEACQIRREENTKELEGQRRSFAYGNLKLHNPNITREMIDKAAEELAKESGSLPQEELPDPDPSNGADADIFHPLDDFGDK